MTDTSTTRPPRPARAAAAMSLRHVLHAELIKLRSLRSTWVLLSMAAVLAILNGMLATVGAVLQDRSEGQPPSGFDATATTTTGISTLVFLVAVVGVLQATGELSTGSGRTTFVAVPRRGMVVIGKAGALAALVAPLAAAVAAICFAGGQAVLSTRDLGVSVFSVNGLQVVLGAAACATAMGLFGQLVAWLVKHTAGAVFAVLGLLSLVGPTVHLLLPAQLSNDIVPYLPAESAVAMMGADPTGASAAGAVALPVCAAWCVLGVWWTARLLRRRDS